MSTVATRNRVHIPLLFLIWVIIGIVVAVNKGYADHINDGWDVVQIVLAVLFWPVLALGGVIDVSG
ncbi:MAG TPA: hypothetical protein VF743_05895 [Acidimicrobiales bacterium]